jgi:MYXO-CTERM domain-containing protein
LIKATLLHSGVSMKGTDNSGGPIAPIPSNEQGWGRIQLDQALLFAGSTRKLHVDDHRAGLAAGATTPFTYTLNGVDAGQPLKVTLVWTDYPGTPDAPAAAPSLTDPSTWNAPRLVNDLDLVVTGPSGSYLGNVFTNGVSTTGGSADKRNNVEVVLLAAPAAGSYTVTVKPVSIVQGDQEFALVMTGAWQSVGPPMEGGGIPPVDASGMDASSPPDVSVPPSGAGGGAVDADPTTGGSSGAGGAAGGSGGAAVGSGGATGGVPPSPGGAATQDTGCSCSLAPVDGRPRAALASILTLLGYLRLRRRRAANPADAIRKIA